MQCNDQKTTGYIQVRERKYEHVGVVGGFLEGGKPTLGCQGCDGQWMCHLYFSLSLQKHFLINSRNRPLR